MDRVAEYSLERGDRVRFHQERDGGAGALLRLTHEYEGKGGTEPGWRTRFERLLENLDTQKCPAGTGRVRSPRRLWTFGGEF